MRSPSYSVNHAAKPDIETKQITLNDLEEGIKLSILADVERDQRLNDFKKSFDRSIEDAAAAQRESNRKRKADRESFNSFVEQARREKNSRDEQYGQKCIELLELQEAYDDLETKYSDAVITIDGGVFENNRLETLLAMKDKEIDDLKETLKLFTPQSPNFEALVSIMDMPDLNLKRNTDENTQDDEEETDVKLPAPEVRVYTKKQTKVVTDPDVLRALRFMADNVYTYRRNQFEGVNINGVKYASYFGKVSKGGNIGMSTNIVLSSNKKVYNISNMDAIVEMRWNQDITNKGKRGYGTIYLGSLTGTKGFETKLQDVFVNELGIHI